MPSYNPLLSRLAATSAAASILHLNSEGQIERALPQSTLCNMLWAYYLNNGLYDELKLAGIYTSDIRLKSIRNPARRVVEFYASTVWPGRLQQALVIEPEGNPAVVPRIHQLWKWSNWGAKRQVAIREAAVTGDVYLKVSQPDTEEPRVYLQVIKPQHVTDKDTDERDYLTYCRIDVPQNDRSKEKGDQHGNYWHTEVWSKDRGEVRAYEHQKGPSAEEEQLGTPIYTHTFEDLGIDFVPIVQVKHLDMGGDFGAGGYTLHLEDIDEGNLLATRLHAMLFRHNNVTWALRANAMDSKTGRPLPPPNIGTTLHGSTDDPTTVELGGEKFMQLPGLSSLESLVPKLDYDATLKTLQDHMRHLRTELPELSYYALFELSDLSGVALRLMLTAAIARGLEVRGNHEDGLVRAHQMALTIGDKIGAFEGFEDAGSYEAGDYEHQFADRNLIALSREEIAELATAETGAGIPLNVSLKESGKSDAFIMEVEEAAREQAERQQQSLATAVMNASASNFNGNGLGALSQPDQ